ncbi:MAG: D-threitol dehydrogenase, partial [Planctomycetota bacterium]|nr:D-threitol dehydrogenase [Planctomycetota bacterium]
MEFKGFDENFSLSGKTALVTGAGAGIGRAIALMFARKGADIAAADMNGDAAEATAKRIGGHGRKGVALIGDITDHKVVESVVSGAVARLGKLDILVNCAGVALLDNAETLSADFWNRTITLNLSALFFMSQAAGRRMIGAGGGKIINMASQGGIVALDRHAAYNSSKAGVIALTKVLACEWAKYNIQVNAISPTVILTELGKKAWAGETGEAMKRKIPAGRFGYPEEVAAAAVYLASDAANLVTGSNLVIDGA